VIVDNEDPDPEVDNAPQSTDDPIIDEPTTDTPDKSRAVRAVKFQYIRF
jgi:hypothetical protein